MLQAGPVPYDDFGSHSDPVVQIDHIAVYQPEAPGGDCTADRFRLIGAVDPVDRGAEIECASTHRIAGTAGHESRQVGLARDHLRRWHPVRPFCLAGNLEESSPLETLSANADSITYRSVVSLNEVQISICGIDNDRPCRLAGAVKHELPLVRGRQLLVTGIGYD